MSGAASISGLASGLDTATIINQLMQLEAVPQSRLKTRVSSEQRAVSALQTLNTKIAALATRTADLMKPAAWNSMAATSSSTGVTAAVTADASPTSFSVRVEQTARTHRLEFTSATGLQTSEAVPTSVRIDRLDGSDPVDLTTDGTLAGLVTAINDPANATGLRATAVRVGPDQYRLAVESTATGAAEDFTLTGTDGSPILDGSTVRVGQDAVLVVGDDIRATSSTNTFTDLLPGVSLTLATTATGSADIDVTRQPATVLASVKGLVDAVNAALADIDSSTAYDATTKVSGILGGEAVVRSLRTSLLASVFPADGASLAELGIQTDRSGKLVLDEAAFSAAYAADPTGVQDRVAGTGGFAERVGQVARTASDSTSGTLTTAITGRNDSITRLNTSIEGWDLRLELRRTALTRQFTALETALNQMNSQSSWLAGQINSLNAGQGS